MCLRHAIRPRRRHVERPTFTVDPPAGGDHLSHPAPAGTYDATTRPPDGELVHAQEHGLVVAWYPLGTASRTRIEIESLAARFSGDVIVVRETGSPPRSCSPHGTGD